MINDMSKNKPRLLHLLRAIKEAKERLEMTNYNLETRKFIKMELDILF